MQSKVLVGIVMGSDSDLETMQEATKTLEKFGIGYEVNPVRNTKALGNKKQDF